MISAALRGPCDPLRPRDHTAVMNSKYVQFGVLLLLCVIVDQWTKQLASTHLATTYAWIDHPIVLRVDDEHDGATVEQLLGARFTHNNADEVRAIARRYTEASSGLRLTPSSVIAAGDEITVRHRKISVVPRYFDFEYTRNPGAAFGILADRDSPWRLPFFVVVSFIAIIVIVMMLRGVDRRDQLAIWALSLIAGGAVGNFIDRVTHGWVIDFVVWKYTDEFRWPTFNLADAFISVGVGLLIVQMGRDWWRERNEPADEAR